MAGPTDALNVITPVVLTALGLVLPEIAKRDEKLVKNDENFEKLVYLFNALW